MEHNARYALQEAQARSAVYRLLRDGAAHEARALDELKRAAANDGMALRDWMCAKLATAGNDWFVAWLQTGKGQASMWRYAKHQDWDYFNG